MIFATFQPKPEGKLDLNSMLFSADWNHPIGSRWVLSARVQERFEFMSWENGESCTSLNFPMEFMSCIPSRRSLGRRDEKTSSLLGNDTDRLEIKQ